MGYGDISDAVLDSFEFSTDPVANMQLRQLSDGILAVWYQTAGPKGRVSTYPVAADGTVGAQIDTWEFESTSYDMLGIRMLQDVATGIYLIAYVGPGSILRVKTMAIATDGTITKTAIDSADLTPWTVTTLQGGTRKSTLNVYAFVAQDGHQDGRVVTVTCNANGTGIAQGDTWEFNPTRAYYPNIAWVSGDIFVVCYSDSSGDMQLETFAISDSGIITKSMIDTEQVHSGTAGFGNILSLGNNDLVLVGFQDSSNDGQVASFTIDSAGTISNDISMVEFEGIQAAAIRLYSLGLDDGGIHYFLIWFIEASPNDATICTYSCASDGTLSAQIDTLDVRPNASNVTYECLEVRTNIWVLSYNESPGADGTFAVVTIETVPPPPPPPAQTSFKGLFVWGDEIQVVFTQGFGYRSPDFGITWHPMSGVPTTAEDVGFDILNEQNSFIGADGELAIFDEVFGETFHYTTGATLSGLVSRIDVDPDSRIAVIGTSGFLYKTSDFGETVYPWWEGVVTDVALAGNFIVPSG